MKRLLAFAFLFAALFAVFAPLLEAPFLFDDEAVLALCNGAEAGNLILAARPVRALSLRLDALLWGADAMVFHLGNILLHLVVVGWVYVLFRKRLGGSHGMAGAGAVLFALSPVALDAVGIVSHRKEMLSAIFLIAGLLVATGSRCSREQENSSRCRGDAWRLVAGGLCFALAVFSKETALVFPLLFACVAMACPCTEPCGGISPLARRRGLWLVLYAVLLGGLAYWQIAAGDEVLGLAPSEAPDRPGFLPVGSSARDGFLAAVWAFPHYLWLMVSPVGHCVDHVVAARAVEVSGVWWVCLLLDLAWLGLIAFLVARRDRLALPLLWISISLAFAVFPPFLSGRHVGVLAERYAYLASIGMAWLIVELVSRIPWRKTRPVLLCSAAALFAATTMGHLPHFSSKEAFARRTLACYPEAWHPHYHLGRLAAEAGDLEQAEARYRAMFEAAPDSVFCAGTLADFLAEQGKIGEGIAVLRRFESKQGPNPAVMNRMVLYFELAGKIREARDAAARLLASRPDDAAAAHQLGVLQESMGEWTAAAALFRKSGADERYRDDLKRIPSLERGGAGLVGWAQRILVVGDSVPQGVGSAGGSLADRLNRRIASNPDGRKGSAYAWTIRGVTAMQMSRDLPKTLDAIPEAGAVDACVILVGHNDAFMRVPPEEILPFEIRMAADCLSRGIRPVLVGPIPVRSTEDRPRERQEDILDSLNRRLRVFCQVHGVSFLDFRENIRKEGIPDASLLDRETGNHLTDAGMDFLADSVLEVFR